MAMSFCSLVLVKRKLGVEEIILLGGCSTAMFAIVDNVLPSVAPHLQQGVGLGLGLGLTM